VRRRVQPRRSRWWNGRDVVAKCINSVNSPSLLVNNGSMDYNAVPTGFGRRCNASPGLQWNPVPTGRPSALQSSACAAPDLDGSGRAGRDSARAKRSDTDNTDRVVILGGRRRKMASWNSSNRLALGFSTREVFLHDCQARNPSIPVTFSSTFAHNRLSLLGLFPRCAAAARGV
jgi:hypothetical protein